MLKLNSSLDDLFGDDENENTTEMTALKDDDINEQLKSCLEKVEKVEMRMKEANESLRQLWIAAKLKEQMEMCESERTSLPVECSVKIGGSISNGTALIKEIWKKIRVLFLLNAVNTDSIAVSHRNIPLTNLPPSTHFTADLFSPALPSPSSDLLVQVFLIKNLTSNSISRCISIFCHQHLITIWDQLTTSLTPHMAPPHPIFDRLSSTETVQWRQSLSRHLVFLLCRSSPTCDRLLKWLIPNGDRSKITRDVKYRDSAIIQGLEFGGRPDIQGRIELIRYDEPPNHYQILIQINCSVLSEQLQKALWTRLLVIRQRVLLEANQVDIQTKTLTTIKNSIASNMIENEEYINSVHFLSDLPIL